jgi:anti-anti-sigma factor
LTGGTIAIARDTHCPDDRRPRTVDELRAKRDVSRGGHRLAGKRVRDGISFTYRMRNGTCLLAPAGEFDRSNAGDFYVAIEASLQSASSVALDFEAVTFVDGGVLSVLLDLLESLEGQGWIAVVRPAPRVRRLLDLVGVSEKTNFRLFPTLQGALKAIDQS